MLSRIIKLFLITFFLYGTLGARLSDRRFVVIIASYNNERWCLWNLQSVLNQDYPNYRVIYVNDCSTDTTDRLVRDFVKQNDINKRVTIINNSFRKGSLANHYEVIYEHCDDQEVAVVLDGDDAFAGNDVLSYLNEIYCTKNIWLSYGQFRELNGGNIGFCRPVPQEIVRRHRFRAWELMPSHLRTYYVWLFKKIKKEDLVDKSGNFFTMTGDLATMIPMIELAAKGHFWFSSKVLYIYNNTNPISDHCKDRQLQGTIDKYIRKLHPYPPLEAPSIQLQ